jgi:type II secretory pathway component GspD/PulD (secretin)
MKVMKVFGAVLMVLPVLLFGQAVDRPINTKIIELQYITPVELKDELASQYTFNEQNELVINNRTVHVTINNATNQVMLTGDSYALSDALQLIRFLDVPPRQIVIEAKIVELDNEKLHELGMDWQYLLDMTSLSMQADIDITILEQNTDGWISESEIDRSHTYGRAASNLSAGAFLKIVQEQGIGKITRIPTIVTTNNKEGTILDGSRITYVTRYSSYGDMYETEEMIAGLYLSVIPSLGESGYLKLQITAKLTELGQIISGSPSETGQIIENTVIAKNGEEFFLGGFKISESHKYKRKVPILGTILPFLFSRTNDIVITRDFVIVLKPMVIDLNPIDMQDLE